MIKLKQKIGKAQIEIEGKDFKSICKISGLLGMIPQKCDACNSDDIFLNHKSPSGNDYYGVKCKTCGAELNFHQKKEGGFYIVHGEKMEVYNPTKQDDRVNTVKKVFQEEPRDEGFF